MTKSESSSVVSRQDLVSIVVPAHNEGPGLYASIQEIYRVLSTCDIDFEIVIVDDGSTDDTYAKILALHEEFDQVKGILFSRNFGKESALLAGLKAAKGSAVITLDADLQHPPQLIPEMIERWREGIKVVHAVKRARDTDSLVTRIRASIFNSLFKYLGGLDIRNSSDYKLLDRVVVNVIIDRLPESKRFYRGLANWVGFSQDTVLFDVASRHAGEGKWSVKALIGLAVTGIVSFTSTPLRIVTILGFLTLLLAIGVISETLWSWYQGTAVSGFSTIIITLLLVGSSTMISLGILGEYVAKIYDEVKRRPSFLVDRTCGLDENEKR